MRFVPLKDEHQQATLCLHRTRQRFVDERTAIYNRMRGMLSEFSVVLPQSPARFRREIPAHLDALPGWARRCPRDLFEHVGILEDRSWITTARLAKSCATTNAAGDSCNCAA
jgi:transposase